MVLLKSIAKNSIHGTYMVDEQARAREIIQQNYR